MGLGTWAIRCSSLAIPLEIKAASGWTAWASTRTGTAGQTILRYNISINDERCLVQDDYGLPAEIYGNLFLNTKAAICCHKEGSPIISPKTYFICKEESTTAGRKSSFHKKLSWLWHRAARTGQPGHDGSAFFPGGFDEQRSRIQGSLRRILGLSQPRGNKGFC